MLERTRQIGGGFVARLATAIFSVLLAGIGQAEDAGPSSKLESVAPKPSEPESSASKMIAGRPNQPLNLLLTRAELRTFIRNYEIRTGEILTVPIDEDDVIVTAPGWQAPMRDVSQDVGGGLAAPFWAIMHPKDAWRIFLPIPPKS